MDKKEKYEALRKMYTEQGIDDETIELLVKREKLMDEYGRMISRINPLVEKQVSQHLKISEINSKICGRMGHRLSPDGRLTKRYGFIYNCLICGRMVGELEIKEKDTFVDTGKNLHKTLGLKKKDDFTKHKK